MIQNFGLGWDWEMLDEEVEPVEMQEDPFLGTLGSQVLGQIYL